VVVVVVVGLGAGWCGGCRGWAPGPSLLLDVAGVPDGLWGATAGGVCDATGCCVTTDGCAAGFVSGWLGCAAGFGSWWVGCSTGFGFGFGSWWLGGSGGFVPPPLGGSVGGFVGFEADGVAVGCVTWAVCVTGAAARTFGGVA
jgi:hypothetical protein